MTGPRKASEVDVQPGVDPELRADKILDAAVARVARRRALEKMELMGPGDPNNMAATERKAQAASDDRMKAFRQRQAMKAARRKTKTKTKEQQ